MKEERKSCSKTNLNFTYQWKHNTMKPYFFYCFMFCSSQKKEQPGWAVLSVERDQVFPSRARARNSVSRAWQGGEGAAPQLEARCSDKGLPGLQWWKIELPRDERSLGRVYGNSFRQRDWKEVSSCKGQCEERRRFSLLFPLSASCDHLVSLSV